jgi:hypothetical protein
MLRRRRRSRATHDPRSDLATDPRPPAPGSAPFGFASPVDGLHDEVCLVGPERGFEPHHSVWQVAQAEHPLGVGRVHGELSGTLSLLAHELTAQPAIPAANALQLSPGRKGRHLDQASLRLGRGHPGDGPNLGIRDPSRRQRRVEGRQLPQRPRHPDLLARGRRVEPDSPGQPVRAALRPLMEPFLGPIELPDTRQQEQARKRQPPP